MQKLGANELFRVSKHGGEREFPNGGGVCKAQMPPSRAKMWFGITAETESGPKFGLSDDTKSSNQKVSFFGEGG